MKKVPTGLVDDIGCPIHVGDLLYNRFAKYRVIVKRSPDGRFYGKLVCAPSHSCANIPYSLNGGKDHIVATPLELMTPEGVRQYVVAQPNRIEAITKIAEHDVAVGLPSAERRLIFDGQERLVYDQAFRDVAQYRWRTGGAFVPISWLEKLGYVREGDRYVFKGVQDND